MRYRQTSTKRKRVALPDTRTWDEDDMNGSRATYATHSSCKQECIDSGYPSPLDNLLHENIIRPSDQMAQRGEMSSSTDTDNDAMPTTIRTSLFRIDDGEAVRDHLLSRLTLLQQQAVKIMAKAWIKGICPKKQARYPYRSKLQQEQPNDDIKIPEFWPIEQCRYVEPDHVNKLERMKLVMHILLLQPKYEEWKSWNKELSTVSRIFETQGWTAFLSSLTPDHCLDGLGKGQESEEKVKQRQKIMADLYKVAAAYEEYCKGWRDGNTIFAMEEYDDVPTAPIRKARGKRRAGDDQQFREYQSPNAASKRGKRTRHASRQACRRRRTASTRHPNKLNDRRSGTSTRTVSPTFDVKPEPSDYTHMLDTRYGSNDPSSSKWYQAPSFDISVLPHPMGFATQPHIIPSIMDHQMSSQESSPITSSFCSSHSSQDDANDPFTIKEARTDFAGHRDFTFERPQYRPRPLQVYNVNDLPQPHFDTLPNSPLVSPMKFEQYPQACGWPEPYHAAPIADRHFGRVSIPFIPSYSASIPPPRFAHGPHYTPYAPAPIVERGEARSITPNSDIEAAYHGFPTATPEIHHHHSLPAPYRLDFPAPEETEQPIPFAYPEPAPDANIPPRTLPAAVFRGYTGESSGVGDGAWT